MKTLKDDFTRKKFFDLVLENHRNGYGDIVIYQISRFSKSDLIRFVNYLHMYIGNLYIDINGAGKLNLFSSK